MKNNFQSIILSFNPISAEALARGRGAEYAEERKKRIKNWAQECPILTQEPPFRIFFSASSAPLLFLCADEIMKKSGHGHGEERKTDCSQNR